MSITTTRLDEAVRTEAERIVTGGTDVRPRLAAVVTRNAWRPARPVRPGGVMDVVRAVINGAREGMARSAPSDLDAVFPQVIDALGDGLSRAALAVRLAVEEVGSSGERTADDLARVRADLVAVHDLFWETIDRGLGDVRLSTTAQLAAARDHLDRVDDQLRAELEVHTDFLRRHLSTLVREGCRAGGGAGRCAAGALFPAVGRRLKQASANLEGRKS